MVVKESHEKGKEGQEDERDRWVLMAVVEARNPNGQLIELAEVDLSSSGLLVYITDTDGNQVFIHRFAWDNLVKAVNELFEDEKKKSHVALKDLLEREKGKND